MRSLAHAGGSPIRQDLTAPAVASVQNIISVASGNGTHDNTGNGESRKPVISADGRFIAFSSRATDLVPGLTDNNDAPDVFLYDRLNNFTQLISSRGGANFTGNGPSGMLNLDSTLGISADGRYIVYASDASDIVPLDTNGATDIFLFDRLNGSNRLVSTKYFVTTQPANGSSFRPVISANGRLVLFSSTASDLSATADTNGKTDVYAANLDNLVAKLVTINLAGNNGGNDGSSLSSPASVSDDGRFVAFDSAASDLVSNDTNGSSSSGTDVFVRDLQSDITTLVSVNAAGTGSGNLNSFGSNAKISGNGRFVVFQSNARDLVAGITDVNDGYDIFRRDLVAGTTSLVSVNLAGNGSGSSFSEFPVINNDGRFVAFSSRAADLVAVDNNNGIASNNDVFVRDMQAAATSLVSINSAGTDSGNSSSGSGFEAISGDGRYVLFHSSASNLTAVDTNGSSNLFLRDLQTAATTLVSTNRFGGAGSVYFEDVLSSDGQVAAFESRGSNLITTDTNRTTDIFISSPPPPGLSVSDATVIEGDSGTTDAVFTVTLTDGPASGNVTASAVTFDGSALSTHDYQFVSSALTFAPGETTKTVVVPVIGDTLFEGNETFTLELRDVTGASIADGIGLGNILDNEQQPTLSVNDITVTEGDSGTTNATFTVTLSGVSNNSVSFGFGLTNGTALEEEDFLGVGGGALIAAGMTSTTITVPIIGDTIKESNENFFLNLANPSNATIADNQGMATIIDDENSSEPATVQFSVWRPSVSEGAGSIVVEVTRSGDLSASSSVDYATSGTLHASDRSDYTSAFGTLTFAPGEASKTITVFITDDVLVEGNEQFLIDLTNAIGATLGTPAESVVKIVDNDTTAPHSNPIDDAPFFVRQHYLDFFSREADQSGLAFWSNQISECQQPGATCDAASRRINVSAAFFLSIEFQETGYLVERLYKSAYGDASGTSNFGTTHQLPVPVVRLNEFLPDTQKIGRGVVVGETGWEQKLAANKAAFVQEFVQRPRFTTAYPTTLTPTQFVDALFANAAVTPSATDRNAAIAEFSGAANTEDVAARGRALRRVSENSILNQQEKNRAFVLMQYFGYLRRNPNDTPDANYTGYDFWLTKLYDFNGNFVDAEMVKAFLVSAEYRQRFGP